MALLLDRLQRDELIGQARLVQPAEACGILAGQNGVVKKVYKLNNVSATPELCYLMDPSEQFRVMKELRVAGLEMVGIYHSHAASPAYPSAKDVELAFYPEVFYVIISLRLTLDPEVRAFRIQAGEIIEEAVR